MPVFTEQPRPARPESAERFRTRAATLAVDRFMTRFIRVGGVSLIAAVFAIFVFILWQVLPLFQGADVRPEKTFQAPAGSYAFVGSDEWGDMPFLVSSDGTLTFVSMTDGSSRTVRPDFLQREKITAVDFKRRASLLLYATADGRLITAPVEYGVEFGPGKTRTLKPSVGPAAVYDVAPGLPIRRAAWSDAGDEKLAVAIAQGTSGRPQLHAAYYEQEQTLFGAGETVLKGRFDLTADLESEPRRVLVNAAADAFVVVYDRWADYFVRRGDRIERWQRWRPFPEGAAPIARADYVFGEVSVVFSTQTGETAVYSLYALRDGDRRLFHPTKNFESLRGEPAFFSASLRNKAFLTGSADFASLRYLTHESVRWERRLPFRIRDGVLNAKYSRLIFLDDQNRLHAYRLHDPHPEAGLRAFFGKVWYEGSSQPKYEWQSTGGSDDFEPKLSLVPLIVGTLKGTFYAMVFAVPIALLAALYTSQFLSARARAIAKPTMEIMASLPSVVLGFLSALWLAPLIETRVPAVALLAVLLPVSAWGCALLQRRLAALRIRVLRPGLEFLYFIPVLLAVVLLCEALGPWIERMCFTVPDPSGTGRIADFRLWWPHATGASFEQRNSLAVGFMMGFAVIPIIFTIAEDALSNVPHSLRAGSLALGASRWQTAVSVVLPTASAGIFSAVMVGLGRAIGETMIVVMATGNTPIMDLNMFSGMRTLSANIAVELPEAPHHGTLYRTLFLGAMVLFAATFAVNTLAEILRQRLREKYKTV